MKRVGIGLIAPVFAVVGSAVPVSAHNRNHYRQQAPTGPTEETRVVYPGDLATPVDPTSTQDTWYFYDDNTDTGSVAEVPGTYEFVSGNGSSSDGSVEFNLSDAGSRWTISTNQLAGRKLADMTQLKFDMFTPNTNAGGTATTLFVNFDVDFDNTTTDGYKGRLVYVPQQNGTPALDTWETWDTIDSGNGMWWWSRYAKGFDNISGNADDGQWPDGETAEYRSWSDIQAVFPNAEVWNEGATGQFVVRAGHPGPSGLQGNVDKVVFGTADQVVTYDFEKIYPTTGSITSPNEGQKVKKTVMLGATYDDGDADNDDIVQWAVRAGTCAASTGTVFGNVDGHNDAYEWDGATFSAELDIRALDAGEYCFVFNPKHDEGQNDVRETRMFRVKTYAPRTLGDCKRDGWKDFMNPSFENQGKCVKYVTKHNHYYRWWNRFHKWHRHHR